MEVKETQKPGGSLCPRARNDPGVLERQEAFLSQKIQKLLQKRGGFRTRGHRSSSSAMTGTFSQDYKIKLTDNFLSSRQVPQVGEMSGALRGSEPHSKEAERENRVLLGHSHTLVKSSV